MQALRVQAAREQLQIELGHDAERARETMRAIGDQRRGAARARFRDRAGEALLAAAMRGAALLRAVRVAATCAAMASSWRCVVSRPACEAADCVLSRTHAVVTSSTRCIAPAIVAAVIIAPSSAMLQRAARAPSGC
ncbi:hypothetical protein G5S35_33010 [Paraburkholderia tropica]|uniref:hypothetical protein n=1 Tax=Paraburkholderia tropica TaxID=92647 RepID=UPI0015FFBE04|nr:hypothetical protein [Paraburkholderia tropica]QNB16444.1 hypothetical protein G5S35_33010 [Paraburkholderia tropica]